MAFNAYDHNFGGRSGGEVLGNGGDPHAESGFVNMFDGIGD